MSVIDKLKLFILSTLIITLCPYESLAQAIRHVHPHSIPPPPRPPRELWPDASFYKWDSKTVVEAFKNNGLEVEDIKPGYTIVTPLPKEATIFLIPSFGENIGGYVSSYNTEKDLKKAKDYYLQMNKGKNHPAWWIFEKDNILLLISGKVPEEKARQYQKVLNELGLKYR
jgi:hypothetical protein